MEGKTIGSIIYAGFEEIVEQAYCADRLGYHKTAHRLYKRADSISNRLTVSLLKRNDPGIDTGRLLVVTLGMEDAMDRNMECL